MMTRQDMNAAVLQQLDLVLQDASTVSELIGRTYTKWFQALAQQGAELLAPAPMQPQQAPAGGQLPAPNGGQQ